MLDRKKEIKILLKYSITAIVLVLGFIISMYYIESNKDILILPITGEAFVPTDWDWAQDLSYDPELDTYCELDDCVTRENIIKEFENGLEGLDPSFDTSKIKTYKLLIGYLRAKDQSDCPFGQFDATPEDVSHDKGDCVPREVTPTVAP